MELNSRKQEYISITGKIFGGYDCCMESWSTRLQRKFKETGWSKAHYARLSGVSYDSVNKYLGGQVAQPRGQTLDKLARPLGVTAAWLREGNALGTTVPLISNVTAGAMAEISDPYPPGGGEAEYLFDWHHDRCFALRVTGESMNRVSPQGSVIIVDPLDRELIQGRRYVFAMNGESTYKQYKASPARLEPESYGVFDAIYIEGQDVKVVGRVLRTFMDFA